MRRFLNSKLTVVALVLAAISLITGATWAATSPTSSSSTSNQLKASVVEIHAVPLQVPVGGALKIAGAGFKPGEIVLFKLIVGAKQENVYFLEGGTATPAGAFLADTTGFTPHGGLPFEVAPGVYTIQAITVGDGHVASSPLIVCEATEGKCPK